jgi:hypothetical protein
MIEEALGHGMGVASIPEDTRRIRDREDRQAVGPVRPPNRGF